MGRFYCRVWIVKKLKLYDYLIAGAVVSRRFLRISISPRHGVASSNDFDVRQWNYDLHGYLSCVHGACV